MSRAAPPQGGSIVYVSSITAFTPGAPLGMYAVSKTALVGLTKALAQELAPRGIRVNCIAPGESTRTPRPLEGPARTETHHTATLVRPSIVHGVG